MGGVFRGSHGRILHFEKVPLDIEKGMWEGIRNNSGVRTKPTVMEATSRITLKLGRGMPFKIVPKALAGIAQWIECRPVNKGGVTGLIPSQGTSPGCTPGPQKGVRQRQPRIDGSLPLFLLPSPPL